VSYVANADAADPMTTGRRSTPTREPHSRSRDERGSVTVEAVVLFPLVLLLIFGAIQAGLYYYARSIAMAAAEQGLQSERTEQGTTGAGAGATQTFLSGASKGLLTGTAVIPTRTATTAAITVTGQVPSLIPGLTLTVSQTAAGAVERITTTGSAG
jgi:Flp pilus assembly protein TadG